MLLASYLLLVVLVHVLFMACSCHIYSYYLFKFGSFISRSFHFQCYLKHVTDKQVKNEDLGMADVLTYQKQLGSEIKWTDMKKEQHEMKWKELKGKQTKFHT